MNRVQAINGSGHHRSLLKGVMILFAVALLSISAYAPDASGARQRCTGKDVYPSQSLPQAAKNAPSGTTFCIHDGTYKISNPVIVQSGDVFWGVYSDGTRPIVTTTTAYHIFDAGVGTAGSEDDAVSATIKNLTISGAVGNDQCEPNCGRGIGGGENLTVARVRLTDNMNSGIGGTRGDLVVRNSTIDHNGSYSFSLLDGGSSSAAGIKSVESMTVINSYIHHNWWNGVWCDEGCTSFRVEGSKVTDNGKAGIAYEESSGPADILGNVIKRNGWNSKVTTRRAGLLIVDSDQAEAHDNTFGSNFNYGLEVADTKTRLPDITDVSVYDNTMNDDTIVGCSLPGVSCSGNL